MNNADNDYPLIDFDKYLQCPDCKEYWVYCPQHRIEVENILAGRNNLD